MEKKQYLLLSLSFHPKRGNIRIFLNNSIGYLTQISKLNVQFIYLYVNFYTFIKCYQHYISTIFKSEIYKSSINS